ncbi:hypothetical protein F183_A43290 [Bryobacterales bacterium F-183]|nr:hypothetical protein F183_A43290 [Bryobacterales bacterium F-183]
MIHSHRRNAKQRGLALITFALSLLILVPLIGVGVDTAMLYIVKERLSSAVQLTARSAARSTTDPSDAARRYFDANFPPGYLGVTSRKFIYRDGELQASAEAPTYFMRIFRYQSVTVTASLNR